MSALGKEAQSLSIQDFEPYQIVYLEATGDRLFAEMVQMAEGKQTCWVRPLVLVFDYYQLSDQPCEWFDLRNGSDLLCPSTLFQAALDTDVIPFLSQLPPLVQGGRCDRAVQQRLNQFMRRLWEIHSDAFHAS